jgi:DNA-directed RNA polymerase specialized sigma24 family protein
MEGELSNLGQGMREGQPTREPWSEEVRASRLARRSTSGGFAPTPKALVARAQRGDREATAALLALYHEPIRRFLRRQGAREDESQDLTQGLFENVLKRETFRQQNFELKSLRSWFCTRAKFRLWSLRARQGNQRRIEQDSLQFELRQCLETTASSDAERLLRRRDVFELLDQVWRRLESDYRAAGEGELFEHLRASVCDEATELGDAGLCQKLGRSKDFVGVRRYRLRTSEFPDALRALLDELEPGGVRGRSSIREAIVALLDGLG